MSIPKGTKVRLENGLDGTVTGYWHPRHEPEPEQPFKVPFPYWVVDSRGQSQVMNERELEVIEP